MVNKRGGWSSPGLRLLLLLAALVAGCTGLHRSRLDAKERQLGTNSESGRLHHAICIDPEGAGLRFPGYVLGVEEARRSAIGLSPSRGLEGEPLFDPDAVQRLLSPGGDRAWGDYLAKRLDDSTRSFVSHIARYDLNGGVFPRFEANFLYDAYGSKSLVPAYHVGAGEGFAKGLLALDLLERDIAARVAKDSITHVLVVCMGWNVPQAQAIERFNSLVLGLVDQAPQDFRPLFIGLTWPSGWAGSGMSRSASYLHKAGDADEVGVLWGNLLLNRVLPSALEGLVPRPRVAAIGHSFGARLLASAVSSGHLLEGAQRGTESGADLFVALQGAFSAERFLREMGLEGSPYEGMSSAVRRVAMTWSEHDTTTLWAQAVTQVPHVGSLLGANLAAERRDLFRHVKVADSGTLPGTSWRSAQEVLYLDASAIVRFRDHGAPAGGAHSDVFHEGTSRLLVQLLDL